MYVAIRVKGVKYIVKVGNLTLGDELVFRNFVICFGRLNIMTHMCMHTHTN